MAPFPDEVDVFTGPHWRMKQLVGRYCDKLSKTNFSNNNDFRALLQSLYETFKEFKMHEQIENECIIGLLQQRSQTIYNVHSDNKLSEMLVLFEKGLKNIKDEYEQLNYAQQLKERLEAFTSDFIPHMKEEEEVFQPMLMEYFTYDELKDIKKMVIAQHCTQKDPAELLRGLSLWNEAELLQKVLKYSVDEKAEQEAVQLSIISISHLPPEVMLNIFSYLNPQELCRCSQVNSKWAQLAKAGSLWRHLYPVLWARGNWYNGEATQFDTEPDEDWISRRKDESRAFQEWDEDADIDESEEAEDDEYSSSISVAQQENAFLHGLIHNILPYVGRSVKTLVLAYSSAITSKMIRQMLEFCPNLEHLDLTQTDVSDSAFDGWYFGNCQNLRHVDFSGCEKITDLTLERLSVVLGVLPSFRKHLLKCCGNGKNSKSSWGSKDMSNRMRISGVTGIGGPCVLLSGKGYSSSPIWILDSESLADIEDAADWKYKPDDGLCVLSMPPTTNCFNGGCCFRKPIPGLRTNVSWQQQYYSSSYNCGHSFCSAGAKLRTIQALPDSSALCQAGKRTPPSEVTDSDSGSAESEGTAARLVRFLSLSGCHQITDHGLRALTFGGGLPFLEHLNLSGCLNITASGLHDLVSACPSLNDEHFYYCDNINGPHADTASGCQNLQCGFRACCRSGE